MMTREEAIEELERLLMHWDLIDEGIYDLSEHDKDAVEIALSALRPVSRERAERVWRGEWIDTNHRTSSCKCTKCGAVQEYETPFCPACGAPMTDEAVQMVIERMEALHENRD